MVALISKGMGYALVLQALMDSGVSGVLYSPIPESNIRSDVYMVWHERKMPAILPAMVVSFQLTSKNASQRALK